MVELVLGVACYFKHYRLGTDSMNFHINPRAILIDFNYKDYV